jgi:hypothetical protein
MTTVIGMAVVNGQPLRISCGRSIVLAAGDALKGALAVKPGGAMSGAMSGNHPVAANSSTLSCDSRQYQ